MNEVPYPTPPRWAERLLSWLVRDAWATPQGDFEEVFHEIGATRGYGAARRWYAWQVIRLLPGRSYENTYWFMVMIRSYFQIAVRSLLKNRVATVINVAGLAITIGCSMVAFLFIHSTLVRDGFHEHADQIFLIEHLRAEDGTMQVYGTSPLPLGPLLNTDVADVELAVRKKEAWVQVKRGPEALGDLISFVDPTFLDLFTFPLQAGRREALHDDRYIILSDNAAHRYFGDQEAVGKPLVLTFNGQEQTFTVGGVAHPFPDNAGLQFNALVDIEALRRLYPPALDDWTNLGATFVKMPPDRAAALPAQLETYHARFQAEAEAYTVGGFAVDRLTDLTLRAEHIRDSIIGGVPWPPIVVLSIISVFLLTLSCINFINIALGTSMKRRREIGVRKVMGSTRGQLVWQFLAEHMVLSMLALAVGVGLAVVFMLPHFNVISGRALTLWSSGGWALAAFLGALLLLVGFLAGAYPAFSISGLQAASIFRGHRHVRRRKVLPQTLLTVQFLLAFLTMIGSVALVLNERFLMQQDWGYNQENTVVVEVTSASQYEVLRQTMQQQAGVLSISGGRDHIGRSTTYASVTTSGEEQEVMTFGVHGDYVETMGLRIVEGAALGPQGDSTAIVVNELFVQMQGWEDAVGQTVKVDSASYQVAGVVEDFFHYDFMSSQQPLLLRLVPSPETRYLAARLASGIAQETVAALEKRWATLAPETSMRYFFQDAVFDRFYADSRGITQVLGFTSLMALLIACMGLFGLSSQNVAERMKEIGVRKVLGATVGQVTTKVNRSLALLLGVAALLAAPLSYVLIDALLSSIYQYYRPMTPLPILVAYALVFLTAALSISTQIYRIVVVNPTDVLRDE